MTKLYAYLDKHLAKPLPKEAVAININLYDEGNGSWSLELIASPVFDENDSDWACDEYFTTRHDLLSWTEEKTWEEVLENQKKALENYLVDGQYASLLTSYQAIGIGFVDGDIELVHLP